MKIICKQCGQEFELKESEIQFYRSKGLHLPKRCKDCRQQNRKKDYSKGITVIQRDTGNAKLPAIVAVIVLIILIGIAVMNFQKSKAVPGISASDQIPVAEETIPTTEQLTESEAEAVTETETEAETAVPETETPTEKPEVTYVLNTYRMKFHKPDCASVKEMNSKNKFYSYNTRDEVIAMGYSPCGNCKP